MIQLNLTHKSELLEYNIPNEWEDITVEKFQQLANADFDDDMNELEKTIRSISIVTDIPEELLYKLSLDNYKLIARNFEFLKTEIKDDFKDEITIDGETYYVKKEFKELTLGESVSIDILINNSGGNLMKCMDMLLTIFLRKKIDNELEEYDTKFKHRAEIFKNIKITNIYNLFGFFLGLKKQ